jgi:hypothetical protein
VIFGYETQISGQTVRRVGFGFASGALSSMTANGGALFDAMIRWAAKSNLAPQVIPGPAQSIALPNTASLSATITDDGLPTGALMGTWGQVSGPGSVTFNPPGCSGSATPSASIVLNCPTTATFTASGDYIIGITGSDGSLSTASSLVVSVSADGAQNQPPTVSAGPDQNVMLAGGAALHATYSDDGLPQPPGQVTVTWSQVSGPGTVTFSPSGVGLDVTASFPAVGMYILRATASDGDQSASDDVTIHVEDLGKRALLITNPGIDSACAGLLPDDKPVKARLERLGLVVTCSDSSQGFSGKDIGVISPTTNGQGVGPGLFGIGKPMVVMEQFAYGGMGLTGTNAGVDFGVSTEGRIFLPAAEVTHPLAAGLLGQVGSVTVAQPGGGLRWGHPGPGAVVVATVNNDPSKPALFAYERGALLFDNATPAPHRRVAFFGAGGSVTAPAGWELFDAAVKWALGSNVPALFVTASATLNSSDLAVKARLENRLGFTVTTVQGSAAQASQATGKALVVISATVNDATVTNKFRDVLVPVVTWEQNIFDDMKMTGPVSGTDYGTAATQTQINVTQPSHPLAAGLAAGLQTVASTPQPFGWGVPSASAAAVATAGPGSGVFGYEVGAPMVGLNAPDRRVGLFFSPGLFAPATPPAEPIANDSAWALFDAAIRWAVASDADGDGLTIFQEYQYGTDPRNPDTNGDGIPDGLEVRLGLNPANFDMDSDGVSNAQELLNGTDPFNPDTDGDGHPDGQDAFPLDPTRWQLGPDPTPGVPPRIFLTDPVNLQPTTCVPATPCP